MKTLSIRQPWAWLVANGHKDIENRTWPTSYRGPLLIHASKGMTRAEWDDVWGFVFCGFGIPAELSSMLPKHDQLDRGGIIGIADLFDCVPPSRAESPWHIEGNYGFALRNARPLPFIPYKGQLGIFDVPDSILRRAA
jgi:hypothetical protein